MPQRHHWCAPLFCFILFLGMSAAPVKAQFCKNNQRIHPISYPVQYWPIHRKVKHSDAPLLEQLRSCADTSALHDREVCAHNRFMYADHVLYYQLSDRYIHWSENLDSFEVELGLVRDSLYSEWMLTLPQYRYTGYFEWELKNLEGLSLKEFQAMGSENFRQLAMLSMLMNRPPAEDQHARALVHETLNGRSPFSAIFTSLALELMQTPGMVATLECTIEQMTSADSGAYLLEILTECSGSERSAISILGALASQRMYLLRDWREWMLQNLSEEAFETQMKVLALSSELHFRMETMGRQFGPEHLYPRELAMTSGSTKAYHFWSAALLGRILAENNFNRTTAQKEATRPAKRYKRFIQFPGFAYNLLLLKHPVSGTTGDYHRVIEEQRFGADWGFNSLLD